MTDLKFEQKSSLSRAEAADQLEALARALRAGEDAELPLGQGVLSLRVPDELRSEVEFEVDGGEIELEIELKWRTDGGTEPVDGEAEAGTAAKTGTEGKTGTAAKTEAPASRGRKSTASGRARRPAAKRT
ncbi:amphi-Trp domain-containing protein [Streptomyces sp. NPDC003327]